jgi:hypothetical protein
VAPVSGVHREGFIGTWMTDEEIYKTNLKANAKGWQLL